MYKKKLSEVFFLYRTLSVENFREFHVSDTPIYKENAREGDLRVICIFIGKLCGEKLRGINQSTTSSDLLFLKIDK